MGSIDYGWEGIVSSDKSYVYDCFFHIFKDLDLGAWLRSVYLFCLQIPLYVGFRVVLLSFLYLIVIHCLAPRTLFGAMDAGSFVYGLFGLDHFHDLFVR
jgi:hypothetical protein